GKPSTVSLRNLPSPIRFSQRVRQVRHAASTGAARLRLGLRRLRTEGNLPRCPSVTSLPPFVFRSVSAKSDTLRAQAPLAFGSGFAAYEQRETFHGVPP